MELPEQPQRQDRLALALRRRLCLLEVRVPEQPRRVGVPLRRDGVEGARKTLQRRFLRRPGGDLFGMRVEQRVESRRTLCPQRRDRRFRGVRVVRHGQSRQIHRRLLRQRLECNANRKDQDRRRRKSNRARHKASE
jgi:hypothetical protein